MIERLDEFMARANGDYYALHDPFADFTTSPEISQIFGEILGLWAGQVWRMLGSPVGGILAEAGPGNGRLMGDALRALKHALPEFLDSMSVHLIETSPRLAAKLRSAFPGACIHGSVDELPPGPLILLANEFLDALPIRQFVYRSSGWKERYVRCGTFIERATTEDLPNCPLGTVIERNDAAHRFVARSAHHLMAHGGAALLIDYGPSRSGRGDTLQAIRHRQPASPLSHPGSSDLSAHVDFEALSKSASTLGCLVSGPIPQGAFLSSLGIHERTAQLSHRAGFPAAADLVAATRRLTAPEAMGSLFKALSIRDPGLPLLPGFPS